MGTGKQIHPGFLQNYYLFRRKVFKIFGGAFHVYDSNQRLLFYSKQKAFKLKEDNNRNHLKNFLIRVIMIFCPVFAAALH